MTAISSLQDFAKALDKINSNNRRHALESSFDPAESVEYRSLFAIKETSEALAEIPLSRFPRVASHAYDSLGAPYGDLSPFHLRVGVLHRLEQAANRLDSLRPGWRIEIFDAYRPLAVQAFMVNHEFERLAREAGLTPDKLNERQAEALWHQVHSIWARPSEDMQLPPPHSTGAALDITLLDETGSPVEMGSAIDAMGAPALPNCYAEGNTPEQQLWHSNRQLLLAVMTDAGFQRHPFEWWHFSYGDQLWAMMDWLDSGQAQTAIYGRLM